jgi:hypothetical protein
MGNEEEEQGMGEAQRGWAAGCKDRSRLSLFSMTHTYLHYNYKTTAVF